MKNLNIYQILRNIKKTQTEGTTEIIYRFGAYGIWNNDGTKETLLHLLTEEEHNQYLKNTYVANPPKFQKTNKPIKVKIKLSKGGYMPKKGSDGAAAFDLKATEDIAIMPGQKYMMDLKFSLELPEGYVALIMPRSGLGSKGLHISNVVGVIDSDYRGSIKACLEFMPTDGRTLKKRLFDFTKPNSTTIPNHLFNQRNSFNFKKGDRILQMIIQKLPDVELVAVDQLSDTDRGQGGYGSTGVK